MYALSRIAAAAPPVTESHKPFAPAASRTARSQQDYTDVLTPLRGLGSIVRFQRGAVIFGERDHASVIYRVISGGVALSRTTGRRRHILDFRFAGEFFGAVHRPEYTTGAEATSDCVLMSYPRGYVDNMFDELPQFRRALAALLAEPVQSSVDTAESRTARERIEAFLLSLSGRIADRGEADLPLSCDDIADRLDVSPAAVDCALRAFTSGAAAQTVDCAA